jgi:FSR family fosmidomycin resistance protein-like MFS transporter
VDKAAVESVQPKTIFSVLFAISFSHLLNDTIQSLIPSIYPIVKNSFHLSFAQVGFITLTFQLCASLLQPVVGNYTDRKPKPFSLATGMSFSLAGLVLLSQSSSYPMLLVSVGLIGIGSSVFHPEASKLAYMAAGNRRGLGAVDFPGRRQYRQFPRAIARCIDHRALWPVKYFMVFLACFCGDSLC